MSAMPRCKHCGVIMDPDQAALFVEDRRYEFTIGVFGPELVEPERQRFCSMACLHSWSAKELAWR